MLESKMQLDKTDRFFGRQRQIAGLLLQPFFQALQACLALIALNDKKPNQLVENTSGRYLSGLDCMEDMKNCGIQLSRAPSEFLAQIEGAGFRPKTRSQGTCRGTARQFVFADELRDVFLVVTTNTIGIYFVCFLVGSYVRPANIDIRLMDLCKRCG